jgi:hypothetical protein
MFMVIEQWEVFAELPKNTAGINRPATVSLRVNDGDLEGVVRALRSSRYEKISFERQSSWPESYVTDDDPVIDGNTLNG